MATSPEDARDVLALNPPSWVKSELPSEQPQHQVRLSAGFWIDKFELTNAALAIFVEAGGYTNRAFWSEAGWTWLNGGVKRPMQPSSGRPRTSPITRASRYPGTKLKPTPGATLRNSFPGALAPG